MHVAVLFTRFTQIVLLMLRLVQQQAAEQRSDCNGCGPSGLLIILVVFTIILIVIFIVLLRIYRLSLSLPCRSCTVQDRLSLWHAIATESRSNSTGMAPSLGIVCRLSVAMQLCKNMMVEHLL